VHSELSQSQRNPGTRKGVAARTRGRPARYRPAPGGSASRAVHRAMTSTAGAAIARQQQAAMPYGTAAHRERAALTRPGSRTFELGEDFAGLRAPAQLLLREDRLAVGDDFEDAPGGGYQAERRHIILLCLEDLFRHTDGMGEIPSTGAVFDRHLLTLRHRRPPACLAISPKYGVALQFCPELSLTFACRLVD
jgi:hypothetical protein